MFVVKFKYAWSASFEVWIGLGQFDSIDKAKKTIPIKFKEIDDYTLQGCIVHNKIQIKFYDVSLKEYIKVTSPWKVGING